MRTSPDSLTPIDGRWARQSDRIGSRVTAITRLRWLDKRSVDSAQRRTERQTQPIKDPRSAPTSNVIAIFDWSTHEQPRAIGRYFRQSRNVLCSVRFVANRGVNGCQPRLDERRPGHDRVGAQRPVQSGPIVAKLELCLGGEKIPDAYGRIIGGCDTNGLKDLFQPFLRLSESREDICDLTLRRKEAWVEFEAALQRPHARLVLTAVLLQQRQTVEWGNRIRRLGQGCVQQLLGLAEIG